MKGIRTTITATVALVAAIIGLTGCAGAHEDNWQFESQIYNEPSLVSINTETGKITKFVDFKYVDDETTTQEVLFEEGYTEDDFEIKYAVYANQGPSFEGSYKLSSTATVEGKQYPIEANLSWQWMPMDVVDQIALYNERIASTGNPQDILQYFTMAELIRENVLYNVDVAITEGLFPAPQYQVTGRSVTEADTRVVSGWQADIPAWQTLQEIQGSAVSSERYYYSFLCATYDVTMTNGEELLNLAKSLPDAQLLQFGVNPKQSTLLIETAQPCTIEQYNESSSDKSYNEPVPPPLDPPSAVDGY